MPVLAVVPARLGSTRLPHKPLQLLAGEPLVVRVTQRVKEIGLADRVVVATDAEAIARVVAAHDGEAVLTSSTHASGTDRVAEVAAMPGYRQYDVIVNIQGDEPFLPADALAGALARVERGDEIGTAAAPLPSSRAADPSRVKVVCDVNGRALYFSRAAIPYCRQDGAAPPGTYWQHLGLYAFQRPILERWTTLPPTALEVAEGLEQLRALQHGLRIGVALLEHPAPAGIDTPEDLHHAEQHWLATQGART